MGDVAVLRKKDKFDACTLRDFKSIMDGEGYDDSLYEITLHPYIMDGGIASWYVSFFRAELGKLYFVIVGGTHDMNGFCLECKTINEWIEEFRGMNNKVMIVKIDYSDDGLEAEQDFM